MVEHESSNNEYSEIQCRSELRERFLWAATFLVGKSASVTMAERTTVNGVFRGIDKDSLSVHMQDLKTPSDVHPWSMLRLTDCFSLKFDLEN